MIETGRRLEDHGVPFSAEARRHRLKELVPGILESDAQLLARLGAFTQANSLGHYALSALDIVSRGKGHMDKIRAGEAVRTFGPLGQIALEVAGQIYKSGIAYRITANPNLPAISGGMVVSIGPEALEAIRHDDAFTERTRARNGVPQDPDLFQAAQNALFARLAELAGDTPAVG